jgi:hypothetical protein
MKAYRMIMVGTGPAGLFTPLEPVESGLDGILMREEEGRDLDGLQYPERPFLSFGAPRRAWAADGRKAFRTSLAPAAPGRLPFARACRYPAFEPFDGPLVA